MARWDRYQPQRDADGIRAIRSRMSDHQAELKRTNERIAAELAKAIAANRPRSTRWT